jgi:Subtilase family
VTVGHNIEPDETGRSGILTSFSSAGLTDFGDLLKPDIAAPGGQILSSTLPEFSGGSPFAVFDGTSMATPQVTGSAALLVQLHRGWRPQQIKSALLSTAGPAWADTARTIEAPVTLEGGGLVNVASANDPRVFTNPASLSFGDLDATHGALDKGMLVRVADAGNGAGTWTVSLAPQSASAGATLDVPGMISVPPGGETGLVAIARVSGDAVSGDNFGFIVLRNGDQTRRIPYAFVVSKPALAQVDPQKLTPFVLGDTLNGPNRVSVYCCPSQPFGPPPDYIGTAMNESGAEKLYVTNVDRPLVNMGVAVLATTGGAQVDPWFLGSKDERDVQGYDGTPVNQNDLMFDFAIDIGAAGTVFPRQGQFYVSVDSGSDQFTHRSLPGRFVLRSWQNDLKPPAVHIITTRVGAGRPTIVARVLDAKSGVDPLSLVIGYRRVLVGAALYDPFSGLALFPLPAAAPRVPARKIRLVLSASDNQETKNVATIGNNLLPNTAFKSITLHGVAGPAVTWLTPAVGQCVRRRVGLAVAASSNKRVVSVRFGVDGRRIATVRRGAADLFTARWNASGARRGSHVLTATATDSAGKRLVASRRVRVCK